MPQMDGARTIKELRQMRFDAPIIISSGYKIEMISESFTGEEISGFIQKPYRKDQLQALLTEVLS